MLEYLFDTYLLFPLPLPLTSIIKDIQLFFKSITSGFVFVFHPLFPSVITGLHHTLCHHVCVSVSASSHWNPSSLTHRGPTSSPPCFLVMGSALELVEGVVVTYLCRPWLSPVTCFESSLKPTDSTSHTSHLSAAAPLSATHCHACKAIQTHTHCACESELPTWTQHVFCSNNSVLPVNLTDHGPLLNS